MRLRPSSLIVFCLFSSTLTRGLGWGLPPGRGWSLALGGVCWRDCGRETPVESLHDRLHISHTVESLVLTKVQNRHIHCGAGRSYQASNKNQGHHQGAAARQTCLVDSADKDPGLASSGVAGGRVARRGRSHTSQRMLLPWLSIVQLLHCHSAEANTNALDFLSLFLTLAPLMSVCHFVPTRLDSPVLGDEGSDVRLSCSTDAAVASRGRSQVVHRTARISFTVVQ